MEVARPVPPYELQTVKASWFYCLRCQNAQSTEASMKYHQKSHHDEENPVYGDDFTNGTHVRILLRRWEEWSLLQVDRFLLQLESQRTVDDFLVDVGAGLKDE